MPTVAQVLSIALGYQRAGADADAIRLCDGILAADPAQADALHLKAIGLCRLGRPDDALAALETLTAAAPRRTAPRMMAASIHASRGAIAGALVALGRVLALAPDDPAARRHLADLLAAAGDREAALAAYRLAATAAPADPAPHIAGAGVLHALGRPAAVRRNLRRGLALCPDRVPALTVLADVEARLGRPECALAAWVMVAALDPTLVAAWSERARLSLEGPDPVAAARPASRAVALDPGSPDLFLLAARALEAEHRLVDATLLLGQATTTVPAEIGARMALGRLLHRTERWDAAHAQLLRAAALVPDRPEPLCNLALVAHARWDARAATALFRRALWLDPAAAEAHGNRGNFETWRDRPAVGARSLVRAIALAPGSADYGFGLSFALRRSGRLAEGSRLYDAGLLSGARSRPQRRGLPAWRGEPLAGRALLVENEQGIGDEIRFASCFPDAISAAGHCILECEPRLVTLFRRSFPAATVRAGAWHPPDARETAADRHVMAGSLTRWFRSTLDAFPDHDGYLVPDPERRARWRQRLDALGPGLRVGICWRSGLVRTDRLIDTTSIELWADVLRIEGIRFVKLQYDRSEEEIARARRELGVVVHDWPEIDLRNDLEEAAALSAAVDVVATVAISVSDMAGAVGTETLVVWHGLSGPLGPPRDPWYPRHRLMTRRWDDPMKVSLDKLAAALRERVRSGPRG